MAELLAAFADAEAVVLEILDAVAPTVTATPAEFEPPMVLVQRSGGEDDGITDYPSVEVTCFGETRQDAWRMAEQCRQMILAAACTAVEVDGFPLGVLVDVTSTVTPAQQLPDPRRDLRVVTASYRLGMRRPRSL